MKNKNEKIIIFTPELLEFLFKDPSYHEFPGSKKKLVDFIENFGMGRRLAGIVIYTKEQLLKFRGVGNVAINNLENYVEDNNLYLGMDIPEKYFLERDIVIDYICPKKIKATTN